MEGPLDICLEFDRGDDPRRLTDTCPVQVGDADFGSAWRIPGSSLPMTLRFFGDDHWNAAGACEGLIG